MNNKKDDRKRHCNTVFFVCGLFLSMFDLDIMCLIVFRAMRSTCHSNVIIVHDCSSTRGHGIDTQNYIRAIDVTDAHIVNLHSQEGEFLFLNRIFHILCIRLNDDMNAKSTRFFFIVTFIDSKQKV